MVIELNVTVCVEVKGRTPIFVITCINVRTGDHTQTPDGLCGIGSYIRHATVFFITRWA